MKRKLCVVLMFSLLLCLFVSAIDAIADSPVPGPQTSESDGGNNGGNNAKKRVTVTVATDSTMQILESYIGEYKNNPEKIRKDYKGLEKMEDLAIAEHTIHSGSAKQITISSKSLDADTPIAVYIVYLKDGKLVRESVNFERDGKTVIINTPQHILDLHLEHIAVDIISFTV
jgi:hypothetical protein